MAKITLKQKRFADEYLKDLNATQAAIRSKYSEKTAYSQGQRLLKNVEVQKYIEEKRKKISEKTEITTEWVIKELKYQYDNWKDQPAVSIGMKSLELLGKHTGAFSDKVELTGNKGGPIQHDIKAKVSVLSINDHINVLLGK